ncbi:MAG: glucokinase [Limisphaerales bacterium]|nr:MAG: glucokinase [Limisphaerales bacterium]KAG0509673.1 MAG: glucokinase [Limisphaerales bacterium]TXT51208.1 MAG: glucokinase [Limisphaerales bacterium]
MKKGSEFKVLSSESGAPSATGSKSAVRAATPSTQNSKPKTQNYFLGLDLGGTSIKAVAVTATGEKLRQRSVPFVDRDMEWAKKIRTLIRAWRRELGEPAGIGLSAPGLAAKDARSIAVMPGRLLGLERLDWTDYLASPRPIPILNDAHAALLGEVWRGAARGLRDVMLFTLGTGVGGAAMVDGHLLRGAIGRAGHLGHITVDWNGPRDDFNTPGSLEHFMGNKFIRERTKGRFASTHELVAAAIKGDAAAKEIWDRSVRALGCSISSLINVLDSDAVIIGGGIARAGETLFAPLERYVRHYEWQAGGHQARIVRAELGDYAGAYGSAANALGFDPARD